MHRLLGVCQALLVLASIIKDPRHPITDRVHDARHTVLSVPASEDIRNPHKPLVMLMQLYPGRYADVIVHRLLGAAAALSVLPSTDKDPMHLVM